MPASSQSEGLTGTPLPPPDDAEEPMRTSISPLNAELAPPSSDAPDSSDPSGVAPGEKDDPNVGAQGGTSEETDQASQAGACRLVGSSARELWLLCVLILPSLAQLRGCRLNACVGIRAWQRMLLAVLRHATLASSAQLLVRTPRLQATTTLACRWALRCFGLWAPTQLDQCINSLGCLAPQCFL